MSASYGKLSPGHEEHIYARKKQGASGREIAAELARGIPNERPVQISANRANRVGRRILDEREELYDSKLSKKPAPEGVLTLTARLIGISEREVNRLDRKQRAGKLDGRQVASLATALERLLRLSQRIEEAPPDPGGDKKGDSRPQSPAPESGSLASRLLDGGDQGETGPETPQETPSRPAAPVADVVVGKNGGSFARADRR